MDQDNSRRLEALETSPDDVTSMTFNFYDEDHTLANPLRYIIMQNPQVKLCGYAVPHPSEHKFSLRIQTYGVPAADVLEKGLQDLQKMCDHVTKTFEKARQKYEEEKAAGSSDKDTDADE